MTALVALVYLSLKFVNEFCEFGCMFSLRITFQFRDEVMNLLMKISYSVVLVFLIILQFALRSYINTLFNV